MDFNFTSQICTTEEQSEKLLALGLRKETADMAHIAFGGGGMMIRPYEWLPTTEVDMENFIPAWSFHRLLELCNVFYLGHRDYDSFINYLENLIKEDCFNKDYLKE